MKKLEFGFTIIELLIATTITISIMGFGVAYFTEYNRRQKVEQTANLIKVAVDRAKFNAVSQLKPTGCPLLKAYVIRFLTTAPHSYQVVADCGTTQIPTTTVPLPTGVQFVSVPPCTLTFKTITHGVSCGTTAFPLSIQIRLTATTYTKTITIQNNGEVVVP